MAKIQLFLNPQKFSSFFYPSPLKKIAPPGRAGQTGQPGQTGQTGRAGRAGQAGQAGRTGRGRN